MDEMDEVVAEFLVESHENLDRLDADLVRLEQRPDDVPTLSSVFRTLHTIKGTCGFLGFDALEKVAHSAENLLSKLRDRKLDLTPTTTTVLLQAVDVVRELLGVIEATGGDGGGDHSALIAALDAAAAGRTAPPEPEQRAGDPRHVGEILVERGVVEPHDVAEALRAQQHEGRPAATDPTIRVDVGLLDKLMNLVGELVLARNQIIQHAGKGDDPVLNATCQRLDHIATELQEGVMKTRMQPIGTVWQKLPRVVRDLSVQLGKRVDVVMEGQETELDKTIIEAIKDPLTHLVRNSVDHGVETPGARVAAGKAPEGTLSLRAFHEGGQVNIEIADDGRGLDLGRIRSRAVERGLVSQEAEARMGDREALELIFLPGFSTAEKVTNVSGRGVGMDVVRSNIERIGGTVEVSSVAGEGTTFRVKIPLTLAIVPALIIRQGDERYAIPQVSLLELVRLEGEAVTTGIEMIHETPVHRLRGRLLPLVELDRELGLGPAGPSTLRQREVINIVVLQADDQEFGLVVGGVNDTEEIVVKPLGAQLKGIGAFAGATIMGDGRVALILDVLGLAQRSGVLSERGRERLGNRSGGEQAAAEREPTTALLVLAAGDGLQVAMPLDLVSRLEEFPAESVERSLRGEVVQYRGDILPLVRIEQALGLAAPAPATNLSVVVHAPEGGQAVGLVVGAVLDIVEEVVRTGGAGCRAGVVGSAVLNGRVTDLIDLPTIVQRSLGSAA